MELTHSTRLSRAINRIRCVFDSGSPLQSWLKQSMSLPRKESAATVAGVFLIATFPVVITAARLSTVIRLSPPHRLNLAVGFNPRDGEVTSTRRVSDA